MNDRTNERDKQRQNFLPVAIFVINIDFKLGIIRGVLRWPEISPNPYNNNIITILLFIIIIIIE